MMKNYIYILFLFFGLGMGMTTGYAQMNSSTTTVPASDGIVDLSIFPNPVSTGKIYITTKENLTKNIEIYDVLGKKILATSLFGKELNISKLTAGIYILKIKEGNNSATRKLVVK
ncbi:T9SS type A sorting domain-containing protein [Gelidibacter maritimus]|uniref:T9SS type A sorting domain-containing protein n=1 Tax=Gelidibacter maritimus TaxID=2761487 RepID=A0A7W2M2M3_9FLAO|nr:T9SS type A sorting domain-containing protein [Gelidibacter maritimus]MBA6151594.1 T9SS type A sorting domain-containing protein [Gelidibacter maritimus]